MDKIRKFICKQLVAGKPAQGMVEFALAIPIVLVMMLGIIEGGRLLFTYTFLAAAGREAARYAAGIGNVDSDTPTYNDCAGILGAAERVGSFAGVTAGDVTVSYDTGPDGTSKGDDVCPNIAADPDVSLDKGNRVVVDVAVRYKPVVPLVPIPEMTLYSESAHTILSQAGVVSVPQPIIDTGGQTCDSSQTLITNETSLLGPLNTVTITNTGASTQVINVLVVWDTTSSPVLKSITDPAGTKTTINSSGPYYSFSIPAGDAHWTFGSSPIHFTLEFSKAIKSSMIIRITPTNECTFGK